jgi:hypothetical protein
VTLLAIEASTLLGEEILASVTVDLRSCVPRFVVENLVCGFCCSSGTDDDDGIALFVEA